MSETGHFITVGFHRGWQEHRPDCICGWTGSYTTDLRSAEREGMEHVRVEGDQ